ncbi:hypothetical protein [Clostridium massiliodielmoense]|uniref:hypothetical protein n=1 Tax=Clostridium massiliodielmoense TaxID=1776385 RepID=UPI001FA90AC5|nr:hypothetical protein [Clostridium massiliodielmoense]
MFSDYDERCILDIRAKTGIGVKKVKEYYEANGCDIKKTLEDIKNKIDLGIIEVIGARTSGIVYGNVSNASTNYGMDKFSTPRGHGFAAERVNHIYDKLSGKDAKIVGDDNAKFGADRVVDGVNIQSKYCKSGSKCIQECFENGRLKYINPDGSPMKIEVPSDKYEAAVKSMENRIKKGQVPGVTDPSKARDIIRKGHFTYEQAKNIAKFGTVESITFDAVNGAVIATTALGLSTVLTFATNIWNGEDFNKALKSATYSGLKIGGTTFITAILSSQLSKAGLNSVLIGSSETIVNIMGPKASAMLVNAFRSGTNIYGAAAMKSAAKMLRGNAITGAVSIVVLSLADVVNIFRGRISGAQLFKNIANTASAVAGWVGGAAAGATVGSFIPIIGTAVGGFVGGILGSFAGGSAANKVSNTVLDKFIEDDADEMVCIIESAFTEMAEDYLLNQKEAENIIDNFKDELTGSTLEDMFASCNKIKFARDLLINHVENEVSKRKKIVLPSQEEMQKGLKNVLEEISDNLILE